MDEGKILVADHQGAFVIKLIGDVRVTLCVAFDDYVEKMLMASNFHSVVIDLTEAVGIDSTTLGMLAKVSIRASQPYGYRPVIVSTNPSCSRQTVLASGCLMATLRFSAVKGVTTIFLSSPLTKRGNAAHR